MYAKTDTLVDFHAYIRYLPTYVCLLLAEFTAFRIYQ